MGHNSTAALEESLWASESPPPGFVSAEERAALGFFSVEGIGPAAMAALRTAFGSLAEAMAAPRDRLLAALRNPRARAHLSTAGDLGALADRSLERARALGARVLFPGRPDWPVQLSGLAFPPVIYVRGTLAAAQKRVALVGSREADPYGLELAEFFARGLARRGVAVISGGAVGVDGAAHRAALSAEGSTAAVLGSGVDRAYPGEHRALFTEMISRGGAVVSHFPPGTPAVAQNFVIRNRLIAALCDAVIVVRAGPTSGALGTARAALALERPVFAAPGDVTCPLSEGCNALLEAGEARALVGLAGVAQALGLDGAGWPSAAPGRPGAGKPKARSAQRAVPRPECRGTQESKISELPEDLRAAWEALARGPAQFDDLAARIGLDAARLADVLVRLEVIGLCQERSGRVFSRI